MDSEHSSIYKILKDQTRQKILLQLQREGPLTYVDLMNRLRVSNTGKFNYHLKILSDMITKNDDGKYCLTEKGKNATQLLTNSPNSSFSGNTNLKKRNIILIATIGFFLILLNPAILENFIGIPLVIGTAPSILTMLYGLFLPGAAMWFLTTRHAKSYSGRDLVKSPILATVLLICLIAIMAILQFSASFFSWPINFRFPSLPKSTPQIISQNGDETGQSIIIQQMTFSTTPLLMLPVAGTFSFIGVFLTETAHRLHSRK